MGNNVQHLWKLLAIKNDGDCGDGIYDWIQPQHDNYANWRSKSVENILKGPILENIHNIVHIMFWSAYALKNTRCKKSETQVQQNEKLNANKKIKNLILCTVWCQVFEDASIPEEQMMKRLSWHGSLTPCLEALWFQEKTPVKKHHSLKKSYINFRNKE